MEGKNKNFDIMNKISKSICKIEYIFEEQKKSVAEWLTDAINGKLNDYGIDLVNKDYPKTEK